MDNPTLYTHLVGFLLDAILLAGVPLAAATAVGFIISFLQAVTQIQDQSMSQTAKISAIVFVLAFFGVSLAAPLVARTELLFSQFGTF